MPTTKYSYAFYTDTFPSFIAMKLQKQNITLTKITKRSHGKESNIPLHHHRQDGGNNNPDCHISIVPVLGNEVRAFQSITT